MEMDVKYKLTSQHQHGSQKDPPQSTHNALQECKLGNLLSKLFLTDICDKKISWIVDFKRQYNFYISWIFFFLQEGLKYRKI